MRPRIAVSGACGRMGRAVLTLLRADSEASLAAALVRPGHPSLGADAGTCAGLGVWGIPVTEGFAPGTACDVVIEFSDPSATLAHAREAARRGWAMVVGTTGFTADQRRELEELAPAMPCVIESNLGPGIHVLARAAAQAAATLGDAYQADIVEAHHRQKKDAPSGTALFLSEAIASAGRPAPSMHSIRAGEIVGDHTVMLSGPGERLELTHRAQDRAVFARGALQAARFLIGASKGRHPMAEVLGLR